MGKILRHSLLWGILLPVVAVGFISSIVLSSLLTPPLINSLQEKMDVTVQHSGNMALAACEDRFSNLLDLRMANNPEMNTASKKETVEEIRRISDIFPNIKIMILNESGEIYAATFDFPSERIGDISNQVKNVSAENGITKLVFWGDPVIARILYFPFWRWRIVSFIPEEEYLAPILQAKRLINLGTFGTLLVVVCTVLFVFLWKVNRPLKQIIAATDEVKQSIFAPVPVSGKDEISQVALAFNEMVNSLAKDKRKIDAIMLDLSESEEQYRVLTENSLALIAVLQGGRFLYTNRMMNKILGYYLSQLSDKSIYDLTTSEQAVKLRHRLDPLESGRFTVDHFEGTFLSSENNEVWLEILATSVRYKGKKAVLIHGIDITSKKRGQLEKEELQNKLSRIEKMEAVGTLAGGVAHDLNNILGGIVGYPELLLIDLPKDDPIYKPLTMIQQSGIKAAAIVQDMLTLTRRGVVVTDIVDLNTIIKEYLVSPEYHKLTSFHPMVIVKTDLATDLMMLDGSSVHLSKAIMNLVTNAMEAIPNNGKVCLSTENRYIDTPLGNYDTVVEGEYVTFTITDNGTGIGDEDLEKIFEPFYTKKVMGRSGTGLGMSVVWGTVKDHNGYIEASSVERQGTVFTLYFPATRRRPEVEVASIDVAPYTVQGKSVLVVDDVEEQRIIATSMLEKLQYTVIAVHSGEEAVEYLQNNQADLVLLDMIMDRGMDGLDTYRSIVKFKPNQKVIIASGYSETDRVKEAQRLGAGEYVKKPYVLGTIATAVKKALLESGEN